MLSGVLIRSLHLSSPHVIPIPDALRNPGPVDVVHRERGGLRVAPRKLAAAVGWRDAFQLPDALVAYLLAGAVSPGRRPFLPGPL